MDKNVTINGFEKVKFKGVFRDYQQRVLDNVDKHLKDGKINISAAPGSGKTVLGLELIRRIGKPCIVLSPTTAIREQWGERFFELFVENEEDFNSLFSKKLHDVKLLNSITYQALYTAIEKKDDDTEKDAEKDAEKDVEENAEENCSDIEIFDLMKECGIKTICLDEAHHLKNEWQKALEKFITALDKDVTIISLTATPPYDSDGTEWNRYASICGEIDEEIFVPELVGQKTLCPHQDYVYFNYPLEEEKESFKKHQSNAVTALDEIGKLETIKSLYNTVNGERNYEELFSNATEYTALLILFTYYGFEVNQKLIKELTDKKTLPAFKMEHAETALQFLLDGNVLSDNQKYEIVTILKDYSVYEKRKVTLALNEKLKRTLISSVGKLESIKEIAKSESAVMGDNLRMLVLTDYIKKENVSKIAKDESFNSINVVSIFETIRKDVPNVRLGVLSGTLVILPQDIDLSDVKHKKENIPNTEYCIVNISGDTHKAVNYVGKLFSEGYFQILVGTKSLLGEGWDSPCINSLILASFVGSFVLSNQMRGRAIRIDKNNPEKSANIWHLVTVEPNSLFTENETKSKDELVSYDYDILKRRFNSFMGPNYTSGVIESGIERLTAIKPPFDKEGIDRINSEMLSLAVCRDKVKEKWNGEVAQSGFSVGMETEVPATAKAPVVNFFNTALSLLLALTFILLLIPLFSFLIRDNTPMLILTLIGLTAVSVGLFIVGRKVICHLNPANSIKTISKAVYKTLKECGLISPEAKIEVLSDEEKGKISVSLLDACTRERNVFDTAITEMLSPIDNPRYILIAKNKFDKYKYKLSFACPTEIGKKKEHVEILAKHLKNTTGNFDVVYTHREEGRKLLLKCKKRSYIAFNERVKGKKYKGMHSK